VDQAQAALCITGEGRGDHEAPSLEYIGQMLGETMQTLNRLGTVLKKSVREWPVCGESFVPDGVYLTLLVHA